jgi:redox-sensitive bicupin YhaK (pirin superfamily)
VILVRRNAERGCRDQGWRRSLRTFSYSDYQDRPYLGVGPLRVINEEIVAPNRDLGMHSRRDMEIISYVLSGQLARRDITGRTTTIGPGTVRRISAGNGIRHSECNPSRREMLRFLQIWIVPDRPGLPPQCDEATFDRWSETPVVRPLVTREGAHGTIPINQDASLSVALLPLGSERLGHPLSDGRVAYCHVVRGKVSVAGRTLWKGDALTIARLKEIVFTEAENAEVLIFDLPGS